eukprot:gb/GECG01001265.1/.p1 GENE.gb/GECG01001265.1/~~gb/GECG01001265.1/.p1  ORF type:complete len:435 (+),score=47.19 gb/GECG01001265.1/:1-1305(+)
MGDADGSWMGIMEELLRTNAELREEVEALIQEEGTVYIYDQEELLRRAHFLKSTFQSKFPSFQNYFAVKACPNPHILRLLTKPPISMGLDCSSLAELALAERWGLHENSNIIFTSNYTSRDELLVALRMGVMINLDDVSLVKDLHEVASDNNMPFPEFLYFRVNPGMGRTDSSTQSNVLGGSTAKFGIPKEKLREAISEASSHGCKRFGLHAMTGSNILENDYFTDVLRCLCSIIENLGTNFEELNLGGGLGVPYLPSEAEIDLSGMVKELYSVMKTEFPSLGTEAHVCMENGRYVTGPAGYLLTRVQVIKKAFGEKFVGVNACMSNLMRPGMYSAYHMIVNLSRYPSSDKEQVNVVGNLCENNDWFARKRTIGRCEVGDLLMIKDVGAHGHSMGFQYNGKLRSAEYLLTKPTMSALKRIRRKETFEDYVATIT